MGYAGVIVPYILGIRIVNTETNALFSFINKGNSYNDKDAVYNMKVMHTIFEDLPVKLDFIVLVSVARTKVPFDDCYNLACKHTENVFVITSHMAKFLAVVDQTNVELTKTETFAIVINAHGFDIHIFKRHSRNINSFVCCHANYTHPLVPVNNEMLKFNNKSVDTIFNVFFAKHKHSKGALPVMNVTPHVNVRLGSLVETLYRGGLAKVQIIAKTWKKIFIEDFCETMMYQHGNNSIKISDISTPLPFNFTKTIRNVEGVFEVNTKEQLLYEKGLLKRKKEVLFTQTYTAQCTVHLVIKRGINGRTKLSTFLLNGTYSFFGSSNLAEEMRVSLNVTEIITAVSPKNTSNSLLSVFSKAPPQKLESSLSKDPKNVLGYMLLSTKIMVQRGCLRETLPLVFTSNIDGDELYSNLAFYNYHIGAFGEARAMVSNVDVLVILHDGEFSVAKVKTATRAARQIFGPKTKISVINTMIAYLQFATKHLLPENPLLPKRAFCAISNEKVCRYAIIDYNPTHGWKMVDMAQVVVSVDLIENLVEIVVKDPVITPRVLFAETLKLSLQRAAAKHNFQLVRVNILKLLAEGVLEFGDAVVSHDTPATNLVHDFLPKLFLTQPLLPAQRVIDNIITFDDYTTPIVFPMKYTILPENGQYELYHEISLFTKKHYLLYRGNETVNTIHYKAHPFTPPGVDCSFEEEEGATSFINNNNVAENNAQSSNNSRTQPHLNVEFLNHNLRLTEEWMNDFSNTLKEKKELLNLYRFKDDTEVISADEVSQLVSSNTDAVFTFYDNSTVKIEVICNNKLENIGYSHGFSYIPLYISFAKDATRIGFSAVYDFSHHPSKVIWDIVKLLGKDVSDVTGDPDWTFSFTNLSDTNQAALFLTFLSNEHMKLIYPYEALTMFFQGVEKLVERTIGKPLKRVFFKFRLRFTLRMKNELKMACDAAQWTFVNYNE